MYPRPGSNFNMKPLNGSPLGVDALEANLVGLWPMYEGSGLTVANYVAGGDTLTFTVNAGVVAWTSGKFAKGFCINVDSGGFGQVPSSADLSSANLTWLIWYNSVSGISLLDMIRKDDNATNRAFLLRLNAGKLETVGIWGSNPTITDSVTSNDGKWHLAAVTFSYDGSTTTTIKLYRDGALIGTTTNAGAIPAVSVPTFISSQNGTAEFWAGFLDSPMAFSRALSQHEVGCLYKDYFQVVRSKRRMSYPPANVRV
jgi:hypothetical protein